MSQLYQLLLKTILLFLFFIGNNLLLKGQNTIIDSLKNRLQETSNQEEQVDLMLKITWNLIWSDTEEAERMAERTIELAQNIAYGKGLVTSKNYQAILYNVTKQSFRAIKGFESAYQIAIQFELNDEVLLGSLQLNQGIAYSSLYNEEKALEHYNRALTHFQKANNLEGQAKILNSIGNLYYDLEEHAEGLSYYKKGLKKIKETDDLLATARIQANIGNSFMKLNAPLDSSKIYLKAALIISQQLGNKYDEVGRFIDLGNASIGAEDYQSALGWLNQALKLEEKHPFEQERLELYDALAETHLALGNTKKATDYANSAVEIAIQLKNFNKITNNYHFLGEIAMTKKDYKAAYAYGKLEKMYMDSLMEEHSILIKEEFEARFEVSQKNKELEIKQLELRELAEKRAALYWKMGLGVLGLIAFGALLFTFQKYKNIKNLQQLSDRIARNLHDNIGGTITKINIIAKELNNKKLPKAELNKEINRIIAMNEDAISNMSDVIWSLENTNIKLINFVERIEDYSDDLFLPLKIPYSIKVSNEVNQERILKGKYGHELLMVFKEGFTNIVKHTQSNKVAVRFMENSQGINISITNFFDSQIQPNFSTNKGLANIKNRIESLKGTLEIQRASDSFTLLIELPKS